jgi:hypothetical protein
MMVQVSAWAGRLEEAEMGRPFPKLLRSMKTSLISGPPNFCPLPSRGQCGSLFLSRTSSLLQQPIGFDLQLVVRFSCRPAEQAYSPISTLGTLSR